MPAEYINQLLIHLHIGYTAALNVIRVQRAVKIYVLIEILRSLVGVRDGLYRFLIAKCYIIGLRG